MCLYIHKKIKSVEYMYPYSCIFQNGNEELHCLHSSSCNWLLRLLYSGWPEQVTNTDHRRLRIFGTAGWLLQKPGIRSPAEPSVCRSLAACDCSVWMLGQVKLLEAKSTGCKKSLFLSSTPLYFYFFNFCWVQGTFYPLFFLFCYKLWLR